MSCLEPLGRELLNEIVAEVEFIRALGEDEQPLEQGWPELTAALDRIQSLLGQRIGIALWERRLLTDVVANVYRFEGSQWVEIPLSVIERLRDSLSLWEEEQK